MKALLLAITFLALAATTVFAKDVTLTWDAPLYPIEYTNVYQINPDDSIILIETGVVGNTYVYYYDPELRGTYRWYVTANDLGEESEPSNIVAERLGKPLPHTNVNSKKNR
jgi:hypothetical protein